MSRHTIRRRPMEATTMRTSMKRSIGMTLILALLLTSPARGLGGSGQGNGTTPGSPGAQLGRLTGTIGVVIDGLARFVCASGGDAPHPKKLELVHTIGVDDFAAAGSVRFLFSYGREKTVADPMGQVTATVRLRRAGASETKPADRTEAVSKVLWKQQWLRLPEVVVGDTPGLVVMALVTATPVN